MKKLLVIASVVTILIAVFFVLNPGVGERRAGRDHKTQRADVGQGVDNQHLGDLRDSNKSVTARGAIDLMLDSSADSAPSESDKFEYEWQLNVGDKVRLEFIPAYPRMKVKDLIDTTLMGANAQDDFSVFKALEFCTDAPRNQATFEARRLELLTTRSPSGYVVVDDTQPAEKELARKFELCEGLMPSDFNNMLSRVKSASDLGLPKATFEYGEYLVSHSDPLEVSEDQKTAYFGLVEKAKRQGLAEGFYWSGYYGINGVSDSNKVVAVASLMVAEAIYREHGSRADMAEIVDREYKLLFPKEREQARARAYEMISADTCCSLIHGEEEFNAEQRGE
ncbi:MAG: hypothetical protein AB8G16_19455 [Gammaproteobacteria bacterium]